MDCGALEASAKIATAELNQRKRRLAYPNIHGSTRRAFDPVQDEPRTRIPIWAQTAASAVMVHQPRLHARKGLA